MAPCSQPSDHLYEVLLCHRCAPSGWPIQTASNVKKNRAARAGHRRIRIVPDLDQPVIREIARAHFFVRIIVGRIFRIDHDMAIIVRRPRVIAPDVCFSYLMIWIIGVFRRPGSFCPARPVPQATPFLPNKTGKGLPTSSQSPPRDRSNKRDSPRIEFHVGAMSRMSCVQSCGTPSPYAARSSMTEQIGR